MNVRVQTVVRGCRFYNFHKYERQSPPQRSVNITSIPCIEQNVHLNFNFKSNEKKIAISHFHNISPKTQNKSQKKKSPSAKFHFTDFKLML